MPETLTRDEFAASIKAKYPAYANVDDAELVDRMLAKYPVYRDRVVDIKTTAALPPEQGLLKSAASAVGGLGVGALKGVGQTATNLGQAVHMIPGVSQAVDWMAGTPGLSQTAFQEANRVLAPASMAQSIGKGAEQIGEFFIPSGAINKAAANLGRFGRVGLEGVVAAGVAGAQGASLPEMGASGALAAVPGALPIKTLRATIAERLSAKAAKRVTEGLGATGKRNKELAQQVAPEFLKRKLGGSLETIAETAAGERQAAGRAIGGLIEGAAGQERHATQPIIDALESVKGKLTTQNVATGASIVTDKAQHAALSGLQDVVKEYGDELTLQQVNALKKIYSRAPAKGGAYAEHAGEVLNTSQEASKAFTSILRDVESGSDALSKLNKEFRFWKSLEQVSKATVSRRSSQGKGLTATIAPVVGAATGFSSGGDLTDKAASAIAGGIAGRKLTTALQSPQWKFVRSRFAKSLADALASSEPEHIGSVVGKILAAEAAHAH